MEKREYLFNISGYTPSYLSSTKADIVKTLLIALPVLLLAGCATSKLDQGLTGLVGKKVDVAVAQLGSPTVARQAGDVRELEWTRAKSAYVNVPPENNQGFYLPRTARFAPSVPQPWDRPLPSPIPAYQAPDKLASSAIGQVSEFCKVTLRVDSKDVVRDYRYDGNFGGCYAYTRALGHKARI